MKEKEKKKEKGMKAKEWKNFRIISFLKKKEYLLKKLLFTFFLFYRKLKIRNVNFEKKYIYLIK